ncbi:5'-methylthioadenosine/adenosylhomocysteine nucleosidase [Clostridium sp. KNHs216]|uniref:5'-methylthioadenosine/adenosylhomocysteine nucleosidase n=1 Tax=Clostridium sp. KNHs216 TaxID=1550235 RepID=UPI00115372F5|nr:5'-methylthioadenosine/adenosylhomocysteine nucleosidase [Clostridium sp. KNHs216]TQI68043.1 adenosylhomocysteine nucleosidase [Clostridium sp. KNHs216]
MIGIIGAMSVEVENLIAVMTDKSTQTVSSVVYYTGRIENIDCVVAKCGVGKVAAAVCTQTMILNYHPSAVINVGVAGGIGGNIHIGDIVVSSGLVQHDMDTTAIGDEKGLISGLNIVTIPASTRLVDLVVSTAKQIYGQGVHVGVIATGDQFISSGEKLREIARDFQASACEMEGGSIAQVCYINHVDFVVIRAISDNANEAANIDFAAFAISSAHKTAELITKILPSI